MMSDILKKIKARAAQGNHKYSWEDLQKIHQDAEAEQFEHFSRQFKEHAAKQSVGRSGILPLHAGCTVDNYIADTPEKQNVKAFAREYIDRFHLNNGSGFIFSGTPGTGKNHLAAAICNELMQKNKTCLVITVTELMQKMRNCYQKDSETSEDQFIRSMVDFDLLILDEIGLQRKTDAEALAINQIVDKRICMLKPTGMLTNLDGQGMNEVLGVRIMDRMRMNGGKWKSFNWASYRK